MVLEVVPEAEGDLEELVPDLFRVADGVPVAAQFQIPVVLEPVHLVVPGGQRGVVRIGIGPLGGDELLRRRRLPRLQDAAHAHGPAVRFILRQRFAELGLPFPAHAEPGAREGGEDAVSGAVGEKLRPDGVEGLRGQLPARDAEDPAVPALGALAGAVEKRGEIFLKSDLFEEDAVPHGVTGGRVAPEVFQPQFLDEARFQTAGGAADPHAHFAGSVAARHGAFVHQQSSDAVPGGGDGGAHAGKAAPHHAEIHLVFDFFHHKSPYTITHLEFSAYFRRFR